MVIHGPHPRASPSSRGGGSSRPAKALVSLKASPSFGVGQVAGEGPSVLILADTDVVATSALAESLADSGVQVTVRPAPEYTWDGTNPSLNGFDVVIHLNGATYDFPLFVGRSGRPCRLRPERWWVRGLTVERV